MVDRHQARNAERRVRPEGERIEEVVVDAAVDHIDALEALRGAHVCERAPDDDVAALHQLDPEFVGQEGMFVVGRIVDARRQQHDRRVGGSARRRHRLQRRQQLVGIVLDRRHAMTREQLRE